MRVIAILIATFLTTQSAPTLQFKGAPSLSKHAVITTLPMAPAAVAAGMTTHVFVEMTPNPGIHVYAPGAKDYQPVTLTVKPQPDLTIGKLTYPKSQMKFFAALKETIPVYEKTFRLDQPVTVGKSLKPGSTITVSATLDFQACDDEVCFIPESVPVSWTIEIK
jgi:hypothetical protein